jgi:hypothetical protein
MSWKDIIKATGSSHPSFEFRTTNVPYNNYDSENNGWPEDGNCIVKWNFSFGQREHGIREFDFHVYEIILQSTDNDIGDITIKFDEDFHAEIDVESYDKIWPTQIEISQKQYDMAQIDVMM